MTHLGHDLSTVPPADEQALVVPGTGEHLSLDAPLPDLARALNDVREIEQALQEAKRIVSQEVLRRMDQNRKWSAHEGDWKLTGDSDAPKVEWDGQHLDRVLETLVEEGLISHGAHVAAVEAVITYKVKQAGLKALLKNPKLAERLDECSRVVPDAERKRYVKVTPA